MSEGDSEVSSEATFEVGDCRLRILDLVARHFLRTLWGTRMGSDGRHAGSMALRGR